jgi:hypothetical protein
MMTTIAKNLQTAKDGKRGGDRGGRRPRIDGVMRLVKIPDAAWQHCRTQGNASEYIRRLIEADRAAFLDAEALARGVSKAEVVRLAMDALRGEGERDE